MFVCSISAVVGPQRVPEILGIQCVIKHTSASVRLPSFGTHLTDMGLGTHWNPLHQPTSDGAMELRVGLASADVGPETVVSSTQTRASELIGIRCVAQPRLSEFHGPLQAQHQPRLDDPTDSNEFHSPCLQDDLPEEGSVPVAKI